MADDNATPILDARRKAKNEIKKRLVAMGTNPDSADVRAEQNVDRLYLSFGKGPIRVLRPFSQGEFYEGSYKDPLGVLVSEIFHGIPDEEKLVATRQREETVSTITEEMLRSGRYNAI